MVVVVFLYYFLTNSLAMVLNLCFLLVLPVRKTQFYSSGVPGQIDIQYRTNNRHGTTWCSEDCVLCFYLILKGSIVSDEHEGQNDKYVSSASAYDNARFSSFSAQTVLK